MDLTPKQQTVKESMDSNASFPQEAAPSPDIQSEVSTEQAYEPHNYDQLFPALPGGLSSRVSDSPPVHDWTTNSDMRIASTDITQVFRIPVEERSKLDGNGQFGESASSRRCLEITAKTGAHIEISLAKDQSLTFVVTGKSDEVTRAKRFALERFQTQARQIVKIPKEHHRFILGKKGKRLQDLEALTGTKIQVPPANSTGEDIIVIGSRDATEKAVHEIQLTSDEQTKQAYEKIDVPKMYHPFINGPNAERVAQMIAEHNVRINLPPPSVDKTEITISGEKDGVMKCKEIIGSIHEEMEKKCQTVSVEVQKSQHKFVMGSRGANISEILKKTNVSVEIPSTESNMETITLRGPGNKLGEALTMVYTMANSVVIETLKAPAWIHKFIIGKKGSNIKLITQDHQKVHVEFTDVDGIIRLEGPPEDVEAASKRLKESIEDFENRFMLDEMEVDPQYYKFIIGKGGANVNRIRQETGVFLSISDISGKNLITLEGSKEGVLTAKQELTDLITKMENEKERDINIEQRFHRNLIGQKGERIREVRDKFNQVQISFPDPGQKCDAVKIRGAKEDVDNCFSYLTKLVQEIKENNYQMKVSIFRQHHKFIIGKSGATINRIREETNARIELPAEGQNSDEIIITGKKQDCEKAKEKILKLQSELASGIELDIIIPCKFHNSLIGAGGKLIQSISEECGGVSIKFPPPESKSDKVTIRGPKDEVQKAKNILIEMSNEKQISGFTAEVRAKPELHRFLIGRNGVNIRKIRDKTGARISFPTDKDEEHDIITIMGKKENVQKAKEELEQIILELDNVVEVVTSVDPQHHRHFVARRGEILRQISDQYGGVTISFPRQGVSSDKVTVKGAKDCVESVLNRIKEIVTDLEEMITVEVEIPQRHHRTVMGARGSKVQGISLDYNVQVKFPEKDMNYDEGSELVNGDSEGTRPQDLVIIQGKEDKCILAKAALLALVPIIEDIEVPFKHHRYIIGVKGEHVRSLITDYEVQIRVPPVQDQKDTITITGPPSNVAAAKEAILKKVAEFDAEDEDRLARSFQVQLRINPEYHPRIIGRRGAVITKIRDKYTVNIQFPPKGSEEQDLITIVGYEQNCHDAQQAILEITGDLESMVRITVDIDTRIHSRLIGTRGRAIRKVMEDFKVDIKFPHGDEAPNLVVVMGSQDNVEDCKEHLLNQMEEFLQDIDDKEDLNRYISGQHPSQGDKDAGTPGLDTGFVVTGAPWTQSAPKLDSSQDFPSMGAASSAPSLTPFWGPKRA